MATQYDVVVIGCGPAGERAAIQAATADRRVAVLERANVVGGARVNWGTIPSKTLRESAVHVYALTRQRLHGIRAEIPDEITVADFMQRERQVVQRELELINQSLARFPIELFRGEGRIIDPHHVALVGSHGQTRMVLETEYIVIAVGTRPNRPANVPFDDECVFDSDTILSLPRIPKSLAVLGAGVIGVEYAATFAALGIEVTLLDTRAELLPYLDREIAGILERELRRLGIAIIHDDKHESISRIDGDPPLVRCTTAGGLQIEAEALLYSVGRDGNSASLGLENAGITPSSRGLIKVNENYQTDQPNIYAAGDIIGYPALASTSMEQGRQAVRHAFNLSGHAVRTDHLPFAIYSIPEVSYIGETEETLRAAGRDYIAGRGLYAMNPRGQIAGDTGGQLKLIFSADTLQLLGVHIVGLGASEMIHTGQALLESKASAAQIAETLYNYPTLSDLYRHAALEAIVAARRRQE